MGDFFKAYPFILPILEALYLIGIILLSAKIIKDTNTVSKTLAYLLLIIFLPIIGVLFYFSFGVNFRKNRFYKFKIEYNKKIYHQIYSKVQQYHHELLQNSAANYSNSLNTINFLYNSLHSPITTGNQVEVLQNGEVKFPKVKAILQQAKKHIHLEYYIYKNDGIGNTLVNILIEKAKDGIEVRFLYDDFGSSKIGKPLIRKLQQAGVQTAPVNRIRFKLFANRANYRDHRKIIIVDGEHVFSGGINVADKYINPNPKQYWRDTHLYIRGAASFYFQYLFLTNWAFAVEQNLDGFERFFPKQHSSFGHKNVQVAASGPDTKPAIKYATTSSIYEAQKRIFITTPYFIPVEPILNALIFQALAGVDVRLLVPKSGDSRLVNAAAYSYYEDLLKNNIRVYFYEKGFIHSKTMLIDDYFSSVGTANMDVRSQELNFEVNTHVYDTDINQILARSFLKDIENSIEIKLEDWEKRPKVKVFFEHLARLFSPLL